MSARNLWSPLAKAFIDVRVFNPQAKANWVKSIPQMYKSHEEEKKQGYLPRVLQVEKGTFTPAVFSTSGGMGKEADRLLRRMAERMSIKRGENYSSVVSFLRRRFRFDLLKTCVIAMRGYKKPTTTAAYMVVPLPIGEAAYGMDQTPGPASGCAPFPTKTTAQRQGLGPTSYTRNRFFGPRW